MKAGLRIRIHFKQIWIRIQGFEMVADPDPWIKCFGFEA